MQKYKLLRDNQIVGYKRVNGDNVLYSYDNQTWFISAFPYDEEKQFLSFDSDELLEIYEE